MTDSVVAFFGGSFDPPHVGHVLVATWALSAGNVDKVIAAPAFEHALGKKYAAPYEARLAMCRAAFAPLPAVEVSDIESRLGGTSRTLVTLEALRDELPKGTQLRLLIGADILAETSRWHRWDDLAALAPPLVAGRRGYDKSGTSVRMPGISSTDVRQELAEGGDCAGIVPTAVVALAREGRHYL